ncbi:MAG: hypothetical protein RIS90_3073 [Pseudomonadota bacterium]|jgi:hypothetical protein
MLVCQYRRPSTLLLMAVIPAQAGIHGPVQMDSRRRGND